MAMPLQGQIRHLRYLVATGTLERVSDNVFHGREAKNRDRTRRYRLNAEIVRDVDGTTILDIDWQWQEQATPGDVRREDPRQGAIHS